MIAVRSLSTYQDSSYYEGKKRPIHCGSNMSVSDDQSVQDGLWTTLIGTASKQVMETYITNSAVCMNDIIPKIVKRRVQEYEKSEQNQLRSMRVLYEGGMVSRRKYTNIRNSGDVMKQSPDQSAEKLSTESVPGVYRPHKPFLLRLADMYLTLHDKDPCLQWFNGEEGVLYVAVGADGAPFGKDDTATAYLVSFLNLLQRVQSCNDNHLILGANCEEDHPLMKSYTNHLREEMEEVEGKQLTTERGKQVVFKFELIPSDMKWMSSHSGELNNCATYFSPFANVNQTSKRTIGGTIGGLEATWQPWDYTKRLVMAERVVKLKSKLRHPMGKQRNEVTKFIAQNKSRQEFVPPLGKYVDLLKAEPLHNTNNAWQSWFLTALAIVMHYTHQNHLKAATAVSDLPDSSPLLTFLKCLKDTLKCGRLYKAFLRWFSEKRKKGISFSYRFTGLESKYFCWQFATLIQELLKIPTLSKGHVLKLHTLSFIGVKLRDAVSIYSRVEISIEQVENLKVLCQQFFNANSLLLTDVTPTVWTVGVAIPYHTSKLYQKLGYGLGLNSMQGREAKHKRNISDSYIPKRVRDCDDRFCHCGLSKKTTGNQGCEICTSDVMKAIKQTVASGKITPELSQFYEN
ncbi:unnamed protein product [Porites lobata]|uniref:Uncharacterized protein n=1 Tax=Porites lobata TaxID=104759 RepID=A0ABN8PQN1_9CNID|nr:unnamed protein product [Porites lobata]